MYSININNLQDPFNMENFISEQIVDKSIDIEFVYNSDFKNAKILRDFISVICKQLIFPQRDMSRLILIIDELNNNAIEYGTESNGKNKIRIKTSKNLETIDLTIEVEDTGKGNKHKNALEMETLRAHQLRLGYGHHESIRGRGLFMIIVKSVDRLYFKDAETGGLIVGIKKNIKI